MEQMSLLMVGIGGYGGYYLKELLYADRAKRFRIVGAVDPYAEKSEYAAELGRRNIPIYDTLEEFYRTQTAQMAILATPIQLHAAQAVYCMEQGSDVLCEKPICGSLEEAERMISTQKRTGRKLAIGFQWSFSESLLQLKRDIMDGVYGKIHRFRTLVYMSRNLDYFQRGSGWAGKRRLDTGEWLLDSVASNAAAHQLHNMLFLLGDRIDRSAEPATILGEIYRANPIEMFDTCALRIYTTKDVELLFYASLAVPKDRSPEFVIEGEKGLVTLAYENGQEMMTGRLQDGRVISYEAPSVDLYRKLYCMADAITENTMLPCVPETVLPHLKCICGLAESFPETPVFVKECVHYIEEKRLYLCDGLEQALEECWREGVLPCEKQLPWAQKPREITGLYPGRTAGSVCRG